MVSLPVETRGILRWDVSASAVAESLRLIGGWSHVCHPHAGAEKARFTPDRVHFINAIIHRPSSPSHSKLKMSKKRPFEHDGDDLGLGHRPRNLATRCAGHSSSPTNLTHDAYTIAWICAIPRKLKAALAVLDEVHQHLPHISGDSNEYIVGRIRQHNIVTTCLRLKYGKVNAAKVATDLIRSFPNIKATLMV